MSDAKHLGVSRAFAKTDWPTRCSEVVWREDGPGFRESAAYAVIGDLVWQPKGGEGHVLVGRSEPFRFGWEEPWTVPVCECGELDFLDHHVFILARRETP